ncbi:MULTISPECIES: ABC transporter ATP-binding protein [Bacillus]|uniref:ABC transporter ATP-binding protein n=2 Tax=Bacillaceae TaxID=186817 RepID=UPI00052AF6D2|nr:MULTISPECIES: ABC transporter ATP-binding protein [Bacillus]AIU76244.1 ABC transporter ATP-binding protein [Bacillus subtilis]UXZ18531.1 ABC transporter ATP-binding protein [Bacillus siamensis]AKF29595.1 ABC transporter ATP-binding protein [Bacillus velezensis]AOO60584.1 ABC transporter ATP-binding protein [Bacillus velezensis]APH47581.1 ABC transporter ATP-binding protein [Bacillus amyloliquefaciens]
MAIIKLENIHKSFGDREIIKNLTLSIQKGSIVTLLGPNGAGKSTTIGIMLGLIKPTSGIVRILGEEATARKVRQKIGVMFQEVSVINLLTVKETIILFRSYFDNPLPVNTLLEISGLKKEENVISTKLSGGQKRRLNFALAMCGDPDLLFLDEPTVGMDISSRQLFWNSLRKLIKEKNKTVILTTHYLEEADSISDRIIFINNGKIISDGSPDELKRKVSDRYITFNTKSDIDEQFLKQLPYVTGVEILGNQVKLNSRDVEVTMKSLMNQSFEIDGLEIKNVTLEDFYNKVTESAIGR